MSVGRKIPPPLINASSAPPSLVQEESFMVGGVSRPPSLSYLSLFFPSFLPPSLPLISLENPMGHNCDV